MSDPGYPPPSSPPPSSPPPAKPPSGVVPPPPLPPPIMPYATPGSQPPPGGFYQPQYGSPYPSPGAPATPNYAPAAPNYAPAPGMAPGALPGGAQAKKGTSGGMMFLLGMLAGAALTFFVCGGGGLIMYVAFQGAQTEIDQQASACQDNLFAIEQATEQYLLDNELITSDEETGEYSLAREPYRPVPIETLVGDGYLAEMPACPSGGTYQPSPDFLEDYPTCTHPGHDYFNF